MGTQLGDVNGRQRSSFWGMVKVGKVSRKRAWDLKVGKQMDPQRRGNRVPGIGCYERIMGLTDVEVREGTPETLGKRSTVDE